MIQKNKVLALDFDHTLYDTDSFLFFEIREPMLSKWNIDKDIWEKAYESAVKRGYNLEKHREELIDCLGREPFSLEELKNFEKKIDFEKYLYGDTLAFLEEAKEKGYSLILLSFGASGWQDKKVNGSGLNKVMDVIHYTKTEGGKKELLKTYKEGSEKVIFIENNGFELDEAVKSGLNIEMYLMNRVLSLLESGDAGEFIRERYSESRKIAEKQTIFKHKVCRSLREIKL